MEDTKNSRLQLDEFNPSKRIKTEPDVEFEPELHQKIDIKTEPQPHTATEGDNNTIAYNIKEEPPEDLTEELIIKCEQDESAEPEHYNHYFVIKQEENDVLDQANVQKCKCVACPRMKKFSDKFKFINHFITKHYFNIPSSYLWRVMTKSYFDKGTSDFSQIEVDPAKIKVEKYESLVCCLCNDRSFDDSLAFEEHIKIVHLNYEFKCNFCNEFFVTYNEKERHLDEHLAENGAKDHAASTSSNQKVFVCHICERRTYTSFEQLELHRKSAHDQQECEFWCEKCQKPFMNHVSLGRHEKYQHSEDHDAEPEIGCDFCDKKFRTKYLLKSHLKTHSTIDIFKCEECNKTYKTRTKLRYHHSIAHMEPKFKCEKCVKMFTTKSFYNQHLKLHNSTLEISCTICQQVFTSKLLYNKHLKMHEGVDLKPVPIEKPFKCDVCTASFARNCHMREHIRKVHAKTTIVLGDVKMECKVCNVYIHGMKKFKEHMEGRRHAESTSS